MNFDNLKIIHALHPLYHPIIIGRSLKIIGRSLKSKQQKQECLYSRDYTISHNENGEEEEK